MENVTVDHNLCAKCGRCVKVCPRGTIQMDPASGYPFAAPTAPCTECGHCAAYCPAGAIRLQADLPPAPVLDETLPQITPEQLSQYLRLRRSVRAYLDKPVEQEKITRLMDTVRYAPTGLNRQVLRWIIVHKPGEVHRLAGMAVTWLREQAQPELRERHQPLLNAWDAGVDAICRGAPHLAIAVSPNDYGLAHTDAVIALSYFEIAAPSLGIGTCWAGYVDMMIRFSPELQKELGIDPQESAFGALLFGYPAYRPVCLPRRKQPVVAWR